jgi:3-hydroxyacyl-[acyl-carrier-protein] dehydratase
MPLPQLDRILEIEPGQSIRAIKCLSLSEDYLQDHFPRFPVMPGVLMLEALYQASAWLVRATYDFDYPNVVLREARNVKYQDFVAPGRQLVVEATIFKTEENLITVKTQGSMDNRVAVSGRLILERVTADQVNPAMKSVVPRTRSVLMEQYSLLLHGQTNMSQTT